MSISPSWKFSTSSAMAWEDMMESCRKAQKSIDLEQYIFGSEGKIIKEFSDLLREKAKEGVRIRLLLDGAGSFSFYQSFLSSELERSGIAIEFHRTILTPSVKRFVPLLLRDHRKLLVVDETEAHIGGVIIEEYARHWRDTSVRLRGAVVTDLQAAFHIAWERAKRMRPLGRVLAEHSKSAFSIAGNSCRLRDKDLYRAIIRHITMAKKNIYITTPYFALTRDLRRALYYAEKKGVEITILLPRRSDNFLADCLSRVYYRRMLRHNIKIFHYTKTILHAKSICIDNRWASVGSCNFDWLSFWWNYELNVISENREFVSELESIFLEDLREAEEVTLKTSLLRGLFW